MDPEKPLAGRAALITGATGGLGTPIARQLAADGAHLILSGRDPPSLNRLAGELQSPAGAQTVRVFAADLADPSQVERLLDFCLADPAGVDVIVNNAAIQGPIGPLAQADMAAWPRTFQVNLFAPVRICQGLIASMQSRRWGKIINLSGGGAASARPDFSAYAASKCALVRFSETLAQELAGSGIDVNCVAPGAMNTRMLQEVLAAGPEAARREYDQAVQRRQSGGASPQQAAELIALLASPASDGISGRLISAVWDDWKSLPRQREILARSDLYTLRRIVPRDRGLQ
jgi:NAD(P)-dependent dehydrogenase (short-subunit alcohol dehydrogenase family)